MPYVPVTRIDGAALLASAERRWEAVVARRPDLTPAVDLQRTLIAIVVRVTGAVQREGLPRLSLPPKYLAAKLARGVPALASEPIPLPVARLTESLIRLCDALAEGGAGDVALHIRAAIEERTMDAGSLLTASLARNQTAIR